MIYKTKGDLERVIALGKPQKVIDLFAASYLSGIAAQPYIDAETEYAALKAQDDQPDVEAVTDPETGEIIEEGYSPNAIRDARIVELETEFPYLVQPEGEEISTTFEDRRPELVLNYALVEPLLREYRKKLRDTKIGQLTVTTASGKVFDADEISQGRMARAIIGSQILGQTETVWTMADNSE